MENLLGVPSIKRPPRQMRYKQEAGNLLGVPLTKRPRQMRYKPEAGNLPGLPVTKRSRQARKVGAKSPVPAEK